MPERPVGPADPAAALADLRSARRRKRVADIHWIDALYQVYLAALVSLAAVLLLSSWIGGERLGPLRTAQVLHDGPDIVGVGVALAILIGLRSGARGGPLAIEPADARHVLLAPIDRALALRSPALHQLRFAAFVAVVVGGIGGQLAVRRLGDEPVLWILSGVAFTLTTLGLAYGAALIAGGRRLSIGVANLVGVALLAWAVADAVDAQHIDIHYSPTGLVGTIPFWPLEFEPLALIPAVLAIVFVLLGVTGLGGLSLEAAERRTRLVGQLKFAATLQDLRTVMVLRRQLAMELPRTKPWIRERGSGRLPVWHRGMPGRPALAGGSGRAPRRLRGRGRHLPAGCGQRHHPARHRRRPRPLPGRPRRRGVDGPGGRPPRTQRGHALARSATSSSATSGSGRWS